MTSYKPIVKHLTDVLSDGVGFLPAEAKSAMDIIEELEGRVQDLTAVLKSLEWVHNEDSDDDYTPHWCPVCKNGDPKDPNIMEWVSEYHGHRKDCRLKAALEEK